MSKHLSVLAVSLLIGCLGFPFARVIHKVKPGETIYRIAVYYDVSTQHIVEVNDIDDVRLVQPGMRLAIYGANRNPPDYSLVSKGKKRSTAKTGKFSWPVKGIVSSQYGLRWGRKHEGMDIAAKAGTPIVAARSGRVIFSGRLGGYGNVVILRHSGDYETVYAHNRKNRVKKGQKVREGEKIAEVGSTGKSTGPHLHFEVRHENRAKNPKLYLP